MNRRENTCPGKKCPNYKRYGEYCPHLVMCDWESAEGDKYTTTDCAPKRSVKLQQQIYSLILGTRKDTNKTRNVTQKFLEMLVCSPGPVIDGEVVGDGLKQIEEG